MSQQIPFLTSLISFTNLENIFTWIAGLGFHCCVDNPCNALNNILGIVFASRTRRTLLYILPILNKILMLLSLVISCIEGALVSLVDIICGSKKKSQKGPKQGFTYQTVFLQNTMILWSDWTTSDSFSEFSSPFHSV